MAKQKKCNKKCNGCLLLNLKSLPEDSKYYSSNAKEAVCLKSNKSIAVIEDDSNDIERPDWCSHL